MASPRGVSLTHDPAWSPQRSQALSWLPKKARMSLPVARHSETVSRGFRGALAAVRWCSHLGVMLLVIRAAIVDRCRARDRQES